MLSGYSERQAHRKLGDPNFRRRVSEARAAIVNEAVGVLTAAGTEAARTLRSLLASNADQVKLSAGRAILELGIKTRESTVLVERIEALERQLEPQQAGRTRNN